MEGSWLLILCLSNASSLYSENYVTKTRSLPVVDALIRGLKGERWNSDDGDCVEATMDMLEGVKNSTLWATWVWDSIQLPSGVLYGSHAHLGSYDQCLQAPWEAARSHPGLRSQYCLVDIIGPSEEQTKTLGPFDDAQDYYRTPTEDGRSFNRHQFGVCLPSICSSSSVAKISQHLLQLTHLPVGNVTLDSWNCEVAGKAVEYSTGFYVFWAVVGVLLTTTVFSTLSHHDESKPALCTITQAFCLMRNYRGLFSVSQDDVKVMHGMRFITAALIVLVHEDFFTMIAPVVNGLDFNKLATSPLGLTLLHLEIVVDTFFAMSGLLLARGLFMGKQRNLLHFLIKRYIRLMGPFALIILFYTTAFEFCGDGPLWGKLSQMDWDPCRQYWWKSLLLTNTDAATVCSAVTWYISCEFQLAVLGTFVFYLFTKSKKLGVASFVAVTAGFTANLGIFVYKSRIGVLPFNYKVITQLRENSNLNYVYLSSPARAGPYLVGMVMGYLMTTYKPDQYRHVINKKWSVIIASIALVVSNTMFAIGAIFAALPYDPLVAAVLTATNRALWGAAICALIAVCEYGSLTLIPSLLGWSGFVPLSKLSYCIYLLHSILLQRQKFSARSATTFSVYSMSINAIGVLGWTCFLSLIPYLALEAPLLNLSNAVFFHKSTSLEQNVTKKEVRQNGNGVSYAQNGLKAKTT